ncbi:MAG TPA: outer membrane beta-barrel protein, partial [Pseudolabrys sp.]
MRHVTFAATLVATGLLASASYAADMPAKMPVKAPPPAGYSWTGFYIGVNGGYGVARDPSALFNFTNPPPGTQQFADSWNLAPAGVLGGIQAGYNYQIDRWVFGIEADFQGSDQKDSVCLICSTASGAAFVDQKMPWFGTVRGRIGWAAGPILSYFTGGWAYGRVETNLSFGSAAAGFAGASTRDNRSGWTIGTGLEAALAGNWTAKVEYLYASLGTTEVPFVNSTTGFSRTMVTSEIRNRIIRAGLNYRFGPTTGTGSSTFPAPTFRNWAGFYAGGNGGYGVGRNPSELPVTMGGVLVLDDQWKESPGGYFGGAQVGYAWQTANIVYGLEADIQGTGMKDSACIALCGGTGVSETVDQKLPWFGTVRGRLGYAAGPALFYLTGGLA